jgi:hypothetical protein
MWGRLAVVVIGSVLVAAVPAIIAVNLIIKGLSGLTSATWNQQEDLLLRFGIGVVLVVVAIAAVAIDHVKNPDLWK